MCVCVCVCVCVSHTHTNFNVFQENCRTQHEIKGARRRARNTRGRRKAYGSSFTEARCQRIRPWRMPGLGMQAWKIYWAGWGRGRRERLEIFRGIPRRNMPDNNSTPCIRIAGRAYPEKKGDWWGRLPGKINDSVERWGGFRWKLRSSQEQAR